MRKIRYVAGIHGNERMPVLALSSLGIAHIVGNPRAIAQNKRFIERDLNSSFGTQGSSYEEKRAKVILDQIDKSETAVDFHTFTGESPAFVIILEEKMIKLGLSLGIEHNILMKFSPKKGHALLNFREGVAVEVGTHDDPKGFDLTQKIAKSLENDISDVHPEAKVYEVFDQLRETGDYINFQMSDEGFVPVLYSDKVDRKTDYLGLKARQIEVK